MEIAQVLLGFLACAALLGYGYLGGREKEKRDVLLALSALSQRYPSNKASNVGPSTVVWAAQRMIESHTHRVLGRRSHYDERKRAGTT